MKDGVDIPGADRVTYTIDSVEVVDAGSYLCKITNTIASQLTLHSRLVNVKIESTVAVNDYSTEIPKEFSLYQNYPNLFNPQTVIRYSLPQKAPVNLIILNLLGEVVINLIYKEQNPGSYSAQWQGTDQNGQRVASGIDLYLLSAGEFVDVKKLLLFK